MDEKPDIVASDQEKIIFRPLRQSDRDEIQKLHEHWFPVKYSNEFFNEAVRNKTIAGDWLYSCVAVALGEEDEESVSKSACSKEAWGDLAASLNVGDGIDFHQLDSRNDVKMVKTSLRTRVDKESVNCIGGCIIGSFVKSSQCHKETSSLLIRDPICHTQMLYIMTLGTIDKFRNCGLAKTLVEMCVSIAEQIPSCGVIYLHVITTGPIEFYEKLGFYQIQEIVDYYTIDGKLHDCYLYAKFINGNYRSLYSVLYNVWHRYFAPILFTEKRILNDESNANSNCTRESS